MTDQEAPATEERSVACCPKHPSEGLVNTPGCYSRECPICGTKVCVGCGATEDMTWANAFCGKCQREAEKKRLERENERRLWKWQHEVFMEAVVRAVRANMADCPDAVLAALKALDEHIAREPGW